MDLVATRFGYASKELHLAPLDNVGRFVDGRSAWCGVNSLEPTPLGGASGAELSHHGLGIRSLAVFHGHELLGFADGWALLREHGTELDLTGTDLRGAGLSKVDLSGAVLNDVDFTGADMSGSSMARAKASGTLFVATNLRAANLRDIEATECSFSRANLASSDFRGAKVKHCGFIGADLTASFWGETEPYECYDYKR